MIAVDGGLLSEEGALAAFRYFVKSIEAVREGRVLPERVFPSFQGSLRVRTTTWNTGGATVATVAIWLRVNARGGRYEILLHRASMVVGRGEDGS